VSCEHSDYAEVEAMGGRVLHQYALLGQGDFLTVIETPDAITMTKIATVSQARVSSSIAQCPAATLSAASPAQYHQVLLRCTRTTSAWKGTGISSPSLSRRTR
jgi:uncharacterized protein with GYD domain